MNRFLTKEQKNLIKEQFFANKKSWSKSQETGLCQDEKGEFLPWFCYDLIDFLKKKLAKNHVICEFGCGSSTLFFAKRCKKVIAIETDELWYRAMKKLILKEKIDNVEIFLMKNAADDENYENFAQNYAKNNEKFDLIIVDSLKRAKSVKNSIPALKSDGIGILLDDSQRKSYQKITDWMEKQRFSSKKFTGIAPARIDWKEGVLYQNI